MRLLCPDDDILTNVRECVFVTIHGYLFLPLLTERTLVLSFLLYSHPTCIRYRAVASTRAILEVNPRKHTAERRGRIGHTAHISAGRGRGRGRGHDNVPAKPRTRDATPESRAIPHPLSLSLSHPLFVTATIVAKPDTPPRTRGDTESMDTDTNCASERSSARQREATSTLAYSVSSCDSLVSPHSAVRYSAPAPFLRPDGLSSTSRIRHRDASRRECAHARLPARDSNHRHARCEIRYAY